MKKAIAFLFLVLIVAPILASCGDKSMQGDPNSSGTPVQGTNQGQQQREGGASRAQERG